MRKSFLILFLLVILPSCLSNNSLKNTSWIGVGNNSNTYIEFQDSTCSVYKQSGNSIDTMQMIYSSKGDTIRFKPMDEYITIKTGLVKKRDGLYSVDDNTLVFTRNK